MERQMPKMKTHSGAKKRFRFTGTGKIMHRKAGKMHLNEHMPTSQKRRLTGDAVLAARRRGQGPSHARHARLIPLLLFLLPAGPAHRTSPAPHQ